MKRKKTAPLLAFLLLASVALTAAWTKRQISKNPGQSYTPRIAVSGQYVYAVWFDSAPDNWEILFSKSADNGSTWQAPQRLTSNSGYSNHPGVAASSANVYTAWFDDTPGNYEIYFKKSADRGTTWQNDKRLTANAGQSAVPVIAVSGADIYVAWYDDTSGYYRIYLKKSADGGATWQPSQTLTHGASNCWDPALAVSGANVYLAWSNDALGFGEIYFRRSNDGGATWQAVKRITHSAGNSQNPAIAVSGANIFVAWDDDTPGNAEIYFRRSTDRGLTWQSAQRLTFTAGESEFPAVAASDANVYVAWADDTPGNKEVYFKKSADGGATWQASQRLTNDAGDSWDPAVAVSSVNVYVAWMNETSSGTDIFLKYSPL